MKFLVLFLLVAGPLCARSVTMNVSNLTPYDFFMVLDDAAGVQIKSYGNAVLHTSTDNFPVVGNDMSAYVNMYNSDLSYLYWGTTLHFDARSHRVNVWIMAGNNAAVVDNEIQLEFPMLIQYFLVGFGLMAVVEIGGMFRRMAGRIADQPGDL